VPRVLAVNPIRPEPAVIAEAAAVLARGGLVAFPTETVYGVGARGLRGDEVARIFAAKERPAGHPLILHVDGEAMARTAALAWSPRAEAVTRALWPGPLTVVVPRAACVPDAATGGLDTVGLRAPAHAVALALIAATGEPLAAPSANAHTHVSPTTADHVVRSLGDRVDLVLDGGPCAHGIESTVLDLTSDPPRVLRAGATSLERLRGILPDVVYETLTLTDDAPRAAPGLASKHYAPRARVVLVPAPSLLEAATAAGRVSVIAWSDAARLALASAPLTHVALLPPDATGYAHSLFAALHAADAAAVDLVVIESVPLDPAWWAVADRLRRAATP